MIKEKIIIGEGTPYPLHGILTLPGDLGKPVPAVVMVHGSGSTNMDEKVKRLTPFKDLAEGLVHYGIASIRYDKRSLVHGKKMLKKPFTVKEETIDDAILAINFLRNDNRIDPNQIFILGHSMGAMLAPRIDADGGDVKGLILLAGTPHRLEEVVLRQLKTVSEHGFILGWVMKKQLKKYEKMFQGLYDLPDDIAKKEKFGGGLTLYYFKEMGQKTCSDYLLESTKPTLIMQGGMDSQVLANDDYRAFKALLADRPNTTFKFYPELNHLFVRGVYRDILKASKEYGIEQHIGDEVFKDIATFIKKE